MLWLIRGDDSSDMIVGCNISNNIKNKEVYELWATRPSGKTMMIWSSKEESEIKEIKRAIDTAIQMGDPVFDLTPIE